MLAVLAVATLGAGGAAAQDAAHGEKIFRKCASCHQIGEAARNRTGPVLTGVIGRRAGTHEGFNYSPSMSAAGEAGLIWDAALIYDYLADPKAFLRRYLDDPKARAKMTFRLRKAQDRRDVIAYLATFAAAAPPPNGAASGAVSGASKGAGNAAAPATDVCVINAGGKRRFFTAEATGGARVTGWLDPGGILCAPADAPGAHGVVAVFESEESLEGCSRLAAAGQPEEFRKYAEFDRCAWKGNDD